MNILESPASAAETTSKPAVLDDKGRDDVHSTAAASSSRSSKLFGKRSSSKIKNPNESNSETTVAGDRRLNSGTQFGNVFVRNLVTLV